MESVCKHQVSENFLIYLRLTHTFYINIPIFKRIPNLTGNKYRDHHPTLIFNQLKDLIYSSRAKPVSWKRLDIVFNPVTGRWVVVN